MMMCMLKTLLLILGSISAVISAPKPKDIYVVAKLQGKSVFEFLLFLNIFLQLDMEVGKTT